MSRKIAVVSDFDGTISERDIGHHFFSTFIPDHEYREQLLEEWKLGLISSRVCLEKELELVRAGRAELDSFLGGERLDSYFKDFVDFSSREKFEILVLSDGLDYYIDRMLMTFGLGFLDFKANHLVIRNGTLSRVEFPYFNLMDCTLCGNCKRFHVEQLKEQGFITVYVGNGFSDRCPSACADLLFAKGDLLEHCRQNGLDHIPFDNFRDVEGELTTRLLLEG